MSTIKERIEKALSRPMTRKQFLKQVGLLILAAVGITSMINALERQNPTGHTSGSEGMAYGSSAYAGGKKPAA